VGLVMATSGYLYPGGGLRMRTIYGRWLSSYIPLPSNSVTIL
jgi:hypothetical protein